MTDRPSLSTFSPIVFQFADYHTMGHFQLYLSKYSEHIILTNEASDMFFFFASSFSLLYRLSGILIFKALSFISALLILQLYYHYCSKSIPFIKFLKKIFPIIISRTLVLTFYILPQTFQKIKMFL